MIRSFFVLLIFLGLYGCSSTPEWKGVYDAEAEEVENNLEVPPDLTRPAYSQSLGVPNIVAGGSTYSQYSTGSTAEGSVLPGTPEGIRVLRDGRDMWLEIEGSADAIWFDLKAFFDKVGFEITREDKALGVMETNYVENRYDVVKSVFSNVLGWIMSSGVKDKYRARIEKTSQTGKYYLFMTHLGLKEHATDDALGGTFRKYWLTRPSEPELEAEMYQRFLVFRGMGKDAAQKLAVQSSAAERTRLVEKDQDLVLAVNEGFARTWRRVGIALDRMGLIIDDRNRSGGLFYIKLTDHYKASGDEEKGWFASLFASDETRLKERYLMSVEDKGTTTVISVYEAGGARANQKFVKRVLSDLKTYLD